jgi:hypothetical protein
VWTAPHVSLLLDVLHRLYVPTQVVSKNMPHGKLAVSENAVDDAFRDN